MTLLKLGEREVVGVEKDREPPSTSRTPFMPAVGSPVVSR